MNISISSPNDIEVAASLNSWLNRPTVRKINISQNKLNQEACRHFEKRIKYLFNDCGCAWGSLVFIVTFFAVFTSYDFGTTTLWKELVISFIIAVPSAFIAKLIALRWSYHRLFATLDKVKKANW
jgi:hypothetical protein